MAGFQITFFRAALKAGITPDEAQHLSDVTEDFIVRTVDTANRDLVAQLAARSIYDLVWFASTRMAVLFAAGVRAPTVVDGDDFAYVRESQVLRAEPWYGAKIWNYLNIAKLRRVGAPCSEMHDIATMLANEQVKEAGIVLPLPVDAAPDHKVIGLPLRIDGFRGVEPNAPPELGSDTVTILSELGYSPTEVARLRDGGVVG